MSRSFARARLMVPAIAVTVILAASAAHAASRSTKAFIQAAAIGNQFEISSSRLALQKSNDESIRNFAQKMVDDHTKAANDLVSAVAAASLQAEEPTTPLDPKHQKMIDKLNSLSGEGFDKEYVEMQLGGHKQTVKLFRDYAQTGRDPTLKAYARNTVPVLEEHLRLIEAIAAGKQ